MGRKAGTLFINPKRFGSLHKPCMKEMAMLLNCMAANHSDMEACARQKELLNACMDSQDRYLESLGSSSSSYRRMMFEFCTWGREPLSSEFEPVGITQEFLLRNSYLELMVGSCELRM
ncbi:uncharacterized protein HKW66_Vig0004470 [Vigna angularis]|uniref:IMS import disulfide relay-system CHCH-CHCH-like Cx9C domain-containing protein n=1 Tax=Phaseolus angularis TaxID=3914 RepID=A0A8T0LDV6_PHAAN|nr:uncharacterized protein HKW66_Vig0004470 [Vigna angularis]